MPGSFAERGRRLVFSTGIVLLAVLAGALLIAFGGITDRLIPLFAIGAFLAFTLSQAGMVAHWRKRSRSRARVDTWRSTVRARSRRALTLLVNHAISKFGEGAWLTVVIVPLLYSCCSCASTATTARSAFAARDDRADADARAARSDRRAAANWNAWSRLTQRGLKFRAAPVGRDLCRADQDRDERDRGSRSDNWELLIANPAHRRRIKAPKLVVLTSAYRQFFTCSSTSSRSSRPTTRIAMSPS